MAFDPSSRLGRASSFFAQQGVGTARAFRSYLGSDVHRAGKKWVREGYGLGSKMSPLGRALGLGFLGYEAYVGYQQGGLWGATKQVGQSAAITYGLGAVIKGLGVGTALKFGGLGAAAVGGGLLAMESAIQGRSPMQMLARPWVNEYMKKHARLEMGAPIKDDYGTVATMRQRSLQAINNSRLNGRTALGNEAALMYTPYSR